MRLSEAMRLGASMKPQVYGHLFDGIGTCAVGAALDAVGKEEKDGWQLAAHLWPILNERTSHPVRGWEDVSVRSAIIDLNDVVKWPREQIADWVETIELQHEQHAIPPQDVIPQHVVQQEELCSPKKI